MMKRLLFLGSMLTANAIAAAAPAVMHDAAERVEGAATVVLPAKKRLPFGWSAFPVTHLDPARLIWPRSQAHEPVAAPTRLRLTLAVDDRSPRHVEVALAESGRLVGTFDLRFAHALELFELPLKAGDAADIRREGLALRLREPGEPLWFISPAAGSPHCPPELQPHLLRLTGTPHARVEFLHRLASRGSVMPFGWMEGCVLDGLRELATRDADQRFENARRDHWSLFLDARGRLVYESPRSEIADETFGNIEEVLPIADLALQDPRHRLVDLALAYLDTQKRSDGLIYSGNVVSAEGSYTIAYPLAAIAARRGNQARAESALRQLLGRRDRLWHEGSLWLRHDDRGQRTFRNWARGVAWHFLGLTRALPHLRTAGVPTGEIEAEIRRTAAFVRPLQRRDGLWNCFLDDPAVAPDTSGSAGIAAALALGAASGVLTKDDTAAARRTWAALESRLTPDGYLTGVAQSNRGGEALQRSDYRVISAMGMGLMAQLLAALPPEAASPSATGNR